MYPLYFTCLYLLVDIPFRDTTQASRLVFSIARAVFSSLDISYGILDCDLTYLHQYHSVDVFEQY